MRTKQVLIRNPEALESFLGLDLRKGPQLKALDLQKNTRIKGVRALLNDIPGGFDIDQIRRFHEATGLRLRVTHHNDQYEMMQVDRKGIYPRPFLNICNPIFMTMTAEQIAAHKEWFMPQEECDIELRYIDSIDPNLRGM